MGFLAIIFAVDVLISTLCVWLASKVSFASLEPKIIAFIVVCVSLVSMIPSVGWILSIVLFFYLFVKAASCDLIDAVWVVLFTKLFSFIAVMLVTKLAA
ncbi:hypothetical protein ACMXYV_09970 [Neptuniibacter sp. SY11_33]|uniref:hypothetical protein n=1 Tax=Neptuniibacter sp. SY11_33 TaxID=3398215 RepID=UPI0039F53FFA